MCAVVKVLHVYVSLERCLMAYFLINIRVKTQLVLSSSQVMLTPWAQDRDLRATALMEPGVSHHRGWPPSLSPAVKLKYRGQHTVPVKNQIVNRNSPLKA